MIVDLSENLEAALKVQADANGVSPARYLRDLLQRELAAAFPAQSSNRSFESGRAVFASEGQGSSAEEIDAHRFDVAPNFGKYF